MINAQSYARAPGYYDMTDQKKKITYFKFNACVKVIGGS